MKEGERKRGRTGRGAQITGSTMDHAFVSIPVQVRYIHSYYY